MTSTVTPGMRIAASWSWRFIVVVIAAGALLCGIAFLSEITIPIAIALLLNSLLNPVRRWLILKGWRPHLASTVVFLAGLLLVIGLVFVVVRQFVSGAPDLASKATDGIDKVQDWLVNGPLKLSQDQIDSGLTSVRQAVVDNQDALTSGALNTATSVGHIVTGLVLVLFTLFFFLRDGERIWAWLLRLAPARARHRIDGAASHAWSTLGGYVRATVLVAFVDAIGIGIGLLVLGVPLAIPLTALVFLASFIPIIGALLSGGVAILVALVTVGFVKALILLAVVIAVQQLEGHVLQPVLLGRAVSLHPLAVALSIAAGVVVGGIIGALLAVPLAATVNAAVKYLAGRATPGESQDHVEATLEEEEQSTPSAPAAGQA
ncbi:AI-2E family transporter [Nakamurella deserti]|uniref:AI-2E family transporter n=1 Tax=Nakamurella deserti TaxID=2164074 RepID=UPI00130056ED|nr:AI-2E family transporter [Nakamurella deserti]